MSKLAVGISVVVVVAGAAVVFLQRETNLQIRGEIALLREEVQQLAKAKAVERTEAAKAVVFGEATDGLQRESERAELDKLRDEVNALKKNAQEFNRVAQVVSAAEAKAAQTSIPTQLVPMSAWKNAGRATPVAAAETLLWAAVGGDVDTLANSIALTASARQKADALFASLAEATRAQYGTPEKLLALMLAKDAASVTGMQVLGQKQISPDDVGMRIRFGNDEGKTKDDNFLMHRGPDGWRVMLPDAPVEKFAKQLKGGK